MEPIMHFGLGALPNIDSVRVIWPDGATQMITQPAINKVHTLTRAEAGPGQLVSPSSPMFFETQPEFFLPVQDSFINDLSVQPYLNNFISNHTPAIEVGDVDLDGRPDLIAGGTRKEASRIITGNGTNIQLDKPSAAAVRSVKLQDLNADGYPEIIIGRSCYATVDTARSTLEIFDNLGGKSFKLRQTGMPVIRFNVGCLAVDGPEKTDGLTRIFVGSGVSSQRYPSAELSRMLVFDNKGQYLRDEQLPSSEDPGIIRGACFVDADGRPGRELVTIGEFEPLRTFQRAGGSWKHINTSVTGLSRSEGWWHSLSAADLDGDGDEDLIAGNVGLNTQFRVDSTHPMTIRFGDFDGNGKNEAITSYHIGGVSYPSHSLDDLLEQLPGLRKRFNTYAAYAEVNSESMFTSEEKARGRIREAFVMQTCIFENRGGAGWKMHPLPLEAQFSPVFASTVADLDGDGRKDIILGGNQNDTRVRYGRYDASAFCVLKNVGGWSFMALAHHQVGTGISLSSDIRSMKSSPDGKTFWVGIYGRGVERYRLK
jgi:hypothetical protein